MPKITQTHDSSVGSPVEEAKTGRSSEGRYLYGVARGKKPVQLGTVGLEGSRVYTIACKEICAIVHDCPAEPYLSSDSEVVKDWVKAHQRVLDKAKERFGSVLPFGFDTILKPGDNAQPPNQVVTNWLKEDYGRLLALMERMEGKDEYAVQVSYEAAVIGRQVSERSEEIRKLQQEMAGKSAGVAYLVKQKLTRAMRDEMERVANNWFRDCYSRIRQHTDDIVVETTRKPNAGEVMLLNLSCLVSREKVNELGEELEKIGKMEGFSVHFSGPWPPYSFVAKPIFPGTQKD